MEKPKPHAVDNVLRDSELKSLKKACKTKKEKLLVWGLIYTGMRISEFLHLNRSWISEDGETIRIPKSMKCSCNNCLKTERWKTIKDKKTKEFIRRDLVKPIGVWMPKSNSGNRVVPLVPEYKPVLLSYLRKYNSIMKVIPNRVYAWRLVTNVGNRFESEHEKYPHGLRGSFATLLNSMGFDTISVTNIMGWSKVDMALKYAKLNEEGVKSLIKTKWQNGRI